MTVNSFYQLNPNSVLQAVENCGYRPTGRYWQLNSYENRVFDLEIEGDEKRIVAKFYRPGRWTKQQIQEEHEFLKDLAKEGITVAQAKNLDEFDNMYFTLWPKVQGRMLDELLPNDLQSIGRQLARIHNEGAQKKFKYRHNWNMPERGEVSLKILEKWVAREMWERYREAADKIVSFLAARLRTNKSTTRFIRIHGDCHKGNILSTGKEFFFVDFDDCGTGPVAQDIWMLLPLEEEQRNEDLDSLLSGYTEFREFDESDIELFEPLRGLRILNYSAWIAQRWSDPSFPQLFPDFRSYNWWAEEVETLEKIAWNLEV
jgi:Ser/Thr protein kinase RdoA (MazF antagonist)